MGVILASGMRLFWVGGLYLTNESAKNAAREAVDLWNQHKQTTYVELRYTDSGGHVNLRPSSSLSLTAGAATYDRLEVEIVYHTDMNNGS